MGWGLKLSFVQLCSFREVAFDTLCKRVLRENRSGQSTVTHGVGGVLTRFGVIEKYQEGLG